MSLLSSFKNDFNAIIEIQSRIVSQNQSNMQTKEDFETTETNINCLLMINKFETDKTIGTGISYYKSTHIVRMELGPEVKIGDKIIDQNGKEYEVKFVYETPGFGGKPDHLVLYINYVDGKRDS